MLVVVLDVDAQDGFEVPSAEDEHLVQALPPNDADPALGEGVRSGRPDRSADDPGSLGAEDLIEGTAELGVPITDHEPNRSGVLGQGVHDVAGGLGDPGPIRMSGHPSQMDPAGVVRLRRGWGVVAP